MKTTDLHLHRDQLYDQLLPRLVGRVFHVTCLNRLEQILASGKIRSNRDGQFPTAFGSTNSFFGKRGCISVFDYRSASQKQIEESICKCSPFHVPSCDHKLAYVFLSPADYDRLIPWTSWKQEQAWSDKIVPYVEAGYPDFIPITSIEEVLRVIIDYPADALVEALKRAGLTWRSSRRASRRNQSASPIL